MHEQLPAVIAKIAQMLAVKPEYFVTHPSELRIVRALSYREVAGSLGCSEVAARIRVARGLGSLSRLLKGVSP